MSEILKRGLLVNLSAFLWKPQSQKKKKSLEKTSIVQYATHIAMYVYVLG